MTDSKYIVFERTGETRKVKVGEWFEDEDGWICFSKSHNMGSAYPILRPIPADRVEVIVKPEPLPYTVARNDEVWKNGELLGGAYTRQSAFAIVIELNGLAARIRELEGQVNRG